MINFELQKNTLFSQNMTLNEFSELKIKQIDLETDFSLLSNLNITGTNIYAHLLIIVLYFKIEQKKSLNLELKIKW